MNNSSKIFRRSNLVRRVTPKNNNHNRKKSAYVNFRVTPEEKEIIFNRIRISGLKIQDYVAQSCMHNKVTAIGNVKTFDLIRNEMKRIDEHLMSIERADELDYEILESLRAVLEILDGFYGNEENDYE